MTLRHLEILKAVAETGNFTQAARRLFITQSAVSHAVRELEEETGAVLFERIPRGVRITGSGRFLLEKAVPLLAAFGELERQAGNLEAQSPLRIASSITIAAFRLPGVLRRFGEEWPKLPVETQVMPAAAAIRALEAGKAEMALVEGTKPSGPFSSMAFDSYEICAVCAPDYRFRERTEKDCFRLTPEQLSRERLLLREPGSALRDTLDSALYLAGYEARPAWVSVNSGALAAAAREGLGIAVLADLLVKEELETGTLRQVEIPGLVLRNQMIAVWPRDAHMTRPMERLIGLLREAGNR